jgi:uncharacterized membrane protein
MPVSASMDEQLSPGERSRTWRARFLAREWFARNLVVVPTLYIVLALVLAEAIPMLEGKRDLLSLELDAESARTFLSVVAAGMIAFTGLVVSIAVVVVQFGASQYTPRLVGRFRRDPVVKHSLGIFIAPAIFALVSLRIIGRDGANVVPSVTVTASLALLIAAVLAFFVLVSRLLDLLRPRRVIARMVELAEHAIIDTYPFALRDAPALESPPAERPTIVRHEGRAGVLSALDRARIVRTATAADAVVEIGIAIGGYVPAGAPLFRVRGNADRLDSRQLQRATMFADERTIAQDPAFAIRAIVDIALRALSPAVNDPTTAVQALDGLDVLLHDLAHRDLDRRRITDEAGHLRLVHPNPGWRELLDLSLTEIRHYGAASPQVPRRLRALLLGLMDDAPEIRQPTLAEEVARLDQAVRAAYPDPVERAHAETPDHLGIGGA